MEKTAELQDDPCERRGEDRLDIIYPVQVLTEDGRLLAFVIRNISMSGVRLLGPHRLLGQKVRVLVSNLDGATWGVVVRILWTCPVNTDLVENGGAFLSGPGRH
jgi:hypothetical protein